MSRFERSSTGAFVAVALGVFSPAYAGEEYYVKPPPQAFMTDAEIVTSCTDTANKDSLLRNPRNKDIEGYRKNYIDGCIQGSRMTRELWQEKFREEKKRRDNSYI